MPNYNKGPMTDAEAMMRRFYNKGPMTDFDRQMPQSMGSRGLLDTIRGSQPMNPNMAAMPLGGLLQTSGNAPQAPQNKRISPEVQKLISDSINKIREGQGLPPAPQEENFLFYIGADPETQQLIDQDWQDLIMQKSGTSI